MFDKQRRSRITITIMIQPGKMSCHPLSPALSVDGLVLGQSLLQLQMKKSYLVLTTSHIVQDIQKMNQRTLDENS